jgi:hypothetical protein
MQTSIGGEGKRAEIDGGYFGGYVKPADRRENRRDRRLRQYQSGKRKVVVVIRERDGRTLPGVFHSEVEALAFIRRQAPRGTELYADEASGWNALHARYTLHRVNHEEAYSLGGEYEINTNSAESFFSRMRRGEIGHHHHVAGPYLIRFAQESAWREDHRKDPERLPGRAGSGARNAEQAERRFLQLLATAPRRIVNGRHQPFRICR